MIHFPRTKARINSGRPLGRRARLEGDNDCGIHIIAPQAAQGLGDDRLFLLAGRAGQARQYRQRRGVSGQPQSASEACLTSGSGSAAVRARAGTNAAITALGPTARPIEPLKAPATAPDSPRLAAEPGRFRPCAAPNRPGLQRPILAGQRRRQTARALLTCPSHSFGESRGANKWELVGSR